MDNIKSGPPPEPGSVEPTVTAQLTTSQPPSLATTAPLDTRSNKRKFDNADRLTTKRLQVEASGGSAQGLPLEPSDVAARGRLKEQDYDSHIGSVTWDHCSPTRESRPIQDPGAQAVSREHNQDDQSTRQTNGRDHDTANRYHEREDQPPSEPRQSSPSELSKANLKLLQRELASFEEMDNEVASRGRGRKRTASRQTSNSDLQSGTSGRSKEPTPSDLFYRYNILRRARIQIHSRPPPVTIQPQLDAIFKRVLTDQRKQEVLALAQAKSEQFCDNLEGASREDDLVELAYDALFSMHKDEPLIHCRKTDWILDLKPSYQQPLNLTALLRPHTRLEEGGDCPDKRQQSDRPFPSPDTSASAMPSPAALPTPQPHSIQDGAVKTPRPDFTCGFRDSTIIKALFNRGLSKSMAQDLLESLQLGKVLYSNPTQHFLELRFPILVVEGKAYATGKTLFEAENQTAVSGSCILNLQRQLTRLHDSVNTAPREKKSPLAFSVCTQGPIFELWVHHLETEDSITRYYMNLLAACHGSLCDDLERFLLKIDCLIQWYQQDYLEEVADQLFAIAKYVAR